MRPATKPDGYRYYEYILIYLDDILFISHQAEKFMETLGSLYKLKKDPKTYKVYAKLDRYVRSKIEEYCYKDELKPYCYISAKHYALEAAKNLET